MINKNYWRFIFSLVLAFSIFTVSLPQTGYAQAGAQTQVSADLQKGLQAVEEKVEKRRQELGVPGVSLVIVKDGTVVYAKGLGYKDFEKKIPVTPDTQFAIGSATKAFTALSVLMSADEGKVNLDDSPKKYLPYFKMKDAETDKNMTVRDLMAHTSGLNRTDLAMVTGRLSRQELIQVAGLAEPMAKLREKFFYQNIMFAAAGEVTAQVQKMPYEKFIPARIFKPLGMTNSTMSLVEMQKAKDYSFGYEYNFDTKDTRRLPFREIDAVAPAGSINSSARDMAKWITFVMNGGTSDGKRLVSEKGYDEWTKTQMKIAPNGKFNYGLGWFLQDWNGLKVVQHGGNIDGFTSLVAMIPEKRVGFVILINASNSPLGNELMPVVWENLVGNPNQTQTASVEALQKEVGKYRFEQAGFDAEIKIENGKLVAVVPNQPVVTLENVGGRKYKVKEQDGFFVTFKDDSLLFENPEGSFTLPKIAAEQKAPNTGEALKELIGKYQSEKSPTTVEIKEVDGKVALVVEGQQPYFLAEKEKDVYRLNPLPDDFSLKIKRDADGKVANIILAQPQGEPSFKRLDPNAVTKPPITIDELMTKTVEAAGGEANWRKIQSRVMTVEIDLIHQGVKGTAVFYSKFPNKSATETTFTALGKTIAKGFEFFDGAGGEELYTFAPVEKFAGKKLEDVRLNSDMLSLLDWKTNYKTADVKGIEKVGDEDCYVVEFTPEKGTRVTELYSTKTFLLLKRRGVSVSSTSDISLPVSSVFSDYREVDGIKLPFKMVTSSLTMGDTIVITTSVKHNVSIDDKTFAPRTVKLD
ncbi:MAG TPA: serine hydrolase [Pyrinomonadaceae bacterium]|jgi:CubicO group peptidase (beta-lactamase class C family)